MVVIENLSSRINELHIVSEWLYSEWGRNNPKHWNSWVMHSNKTDDIPQTWGLFVNDELVGTYSLWLCDLQSRQDLSPWFGGLYICPKYRGKVINGKKLGEQMIAHAINTLKKLGYAEAYLFTYTSPEYYKRFGWLPVYSEVDDCDIPVTICKISL